jgi:iron complex outermembrane receptor protein
MIDRVEVIKGPQGVLYGFGGFGGAINLVTKAPLREWRGEVMSRVGSFGAYSGGFDVGGPLSEDGDLRFRLNGELEESELFVHDFDLNRRNFDFQLDWDVSDSFRVHTDVAYLSREQTSYSGLPLFGTVIGTDEIQLDVRSNYGDPGYQLETAGWFFRYGTEYDIADDWTFGVTGHYHTFDQDSQSTRFGDRVPGTLSVARSYSSTHESDWETSLDLRLNGKFDTGFIGNNAAIGVTGNAFRGGYYGDYGLTDEIIDLRASSYGRPIPDTVRSFVIPEDRDRLDSVGVYAQDLFTLTERWKALAGVRYDSVKHDTQFDTTFFKAAYSQVTWQAGTTYDVTPGLTLFGGYATGFNPDNVLFFPLADGTSFQPETSWQVESGVKFTKDWFTGTLSGFRIVRDNVVTSDPSDPFGYRASGQQTTDGLELETRADLAPGWQLGVGYALLDATVTRDPVIPTGNRVPNVAEQSVRGFSRYVIQDGSLRGLGFSAGLNWTGERFGTLDNTYVMPAYTTLDLGVSYEHKQWIAELFLNNVTDEIYFRNGGSTSVFPGEPFNVTGRFSVKF